MARNVKTKTKRNIPLCMRHAASSLSVVFSASVFLLCTPLLLNGGAWWRNKCKIATAWAKGQQRHFQEWLIRWQLMGWWAEWLILGLSLQQPFRITNNLPWCPEVCYIEISLCITSMRRTTVPWSCTNNRACKNYQSETVFVYGRQQAKASS